MPPADDYDESVPIQDTQAAQEIHVLMRGLQQLALDAEEEIPADFHATVMANVRALPQPRQRGGWFARLFPVRSPVWVPALATVCVLSLGLNVWQGIEILQEAPHGPPSENRAYERRFLADFSRSPNLQVTQGDTYVTLGDYANALRAYEAFLQADKQAPVAQVLRKVAGVQYQLGQYRQAMEAATAALLLNPQEAPAYRYRGMAVEALGHRAQAVQDLQQAARLGDDPEAQRILQGWGLSW